MKSVIAITTIRTAKGPATRESTDTEFHARNTMMQIQIGTTGHTSRIFRVTMLPTPSRRKFPSMMGTNEFW